MLRLAMIYADGGFFSGMRAGHFRASTNAITTGI
jgi:hypothetical protein